MTTYNFYKNGDLEIPRGVSKSSFDTAPYGHLFTANPQNFPARPYIFLQSADFQLSSYKILRSLKNIINRNKAIDPIFDFDQIYGNEISIIALNGYHLGSGIEKGSVQLSIYLTGSTLAVASDSKENGVLYDAGGEKVGFVLYKEGFFILTNSASLKNINEDFTYLRDDNLNNSNNINGNLRWTLFGSNNDNYNFSPQYGTINSVPTNVTFTYAEKYSLNHSNNPTYLKYGQALSSSTPTTLVENKNLLIKQINSSPHTLGVTEFEKETYITRIGLYDSEKKLLALGNLATPIRKTENREFTIKLKIDF